MQEMWAGSPNQLAVAGNALDLFGEQIIDNQLVILRIGSNNISVRHRNCNKLSHGVCDLELNKVLSHSYSLSLSVNY